MVRKRQDSNRGKCHYKRRPRSIRQSTQRPKTQHACSHIHNRKRKHSYTAQRDNKHKQKHSNHDHITYRIFCFATVICSFVLVPFPSVLQSKLHVSTFNEEGATGPWQTGVSPIPDRLKLHQRLHALYSWPSQLLKSGEV